MYQYCFKLAPNSVIALAVTESCMRRAGFSKTFPSPPDTNLAKADHLRRWKPARMVYYSMLGTVILSSSKFQTGADLKCGSLDLESCNQKGLNVKPGFNFFPLA